jgi:hypothetical protein
VLSCLSPNFALCGCRMRAQPAYHSGQSCKRHPLRDVLDGTYKQQRRNVFSAVAAQRCAELLVAKVCMIRLPHVRSAGPTLRPELQKAPSSDVLDDAHKRQRHNVFMQWQRRDGLRCLWPKFA